LLEAAQAAPIMEAAVPEVIEQIIHQVLLFQLQNYLAVEVQLKVNFQFFLLPDQ
jgi:hypothetical protein